MDGFMVLMASIDNNGMASRQQEMADAQTTMNLTNVEEQIYENVNATLKNDLSQINNLTDAYQIETETLKEAEAQGMTKQQYEMYKKQAENEYGGPDAVQAQLGEAQTQFTSDNTAGQSSENAIDSCVQSEQSDTSNTATDLQQKAAQLGTAVTGVQSTLSTLLGHFPTG